MQDTKEKILTRIQIKIMDKITIIDLTITLIINKDKIIKIIHMFVIYATSQVIQLKIVLIHSLKQISKVKIKHSKKINQIIILMCAISAISLVIYSRIAPILRIEPTNKEIKHIKELNLIM